MLPEFLTFVVWFSSVLLLAHWLISESEDPAKNVEKTNWGSLK